MCKNNKKIPIVFSFDDIYALPASIAIKSLIDNKKESTEYEIIIFYNNLSYKTKLKMESIYKIRWIKISSVFFKDVPIGWSGLETYYRLLLAKILPEYDKVIWSDVDVLFKEDLSDIYNSDLSMYDWAGVAAEIKDETNGIHCHFEANKKPYIFMPGFMIANLSLWREKNMLQRFEDIIKNYSNKLKMFDLDILNLAADNIKEIPFEYCVLENIYDASDITTALEYPWLSKAQSKEKLLKAKENPAIIHYAGQLVKIWLREKHNIPKYYWNYIISSPFFDAEFYTPGVKNKMEILYYTFLRKICPIKSIRTKLKKKINYSNYKKYWEFLNHG